MTENRRPLAQTTIWCAQLQSLELEWKKTAEKVSLS